MIIHLINFSNLSLNMKQLKSKNYAENYLTIMHELLIDKNKYQ